MPKYVLAYVGGRQVPDPQTRAAQMTKWKAWVDALGERMVNPGMPLGQGKLVTANGVSERGPTPLTGFSIVLADNMDAALEIAQRCPFLEIGTIEVAEAMEMR
jgi:YCII-related domain